MPRKPYPPTLRARGRKLSDSLREARERRGLSQEELAVKSGLSVDEIRKLEQRLIAQPGFFTVADIARALRTGLTGIDNESR